MKKLITVLHLQTSINKSCGVSRYMRTLMSYTSPDLHHHALCLRSDLSNAEISSAENLSVIKKNGFLPHVVNDYLSILRYCKKHSVDIIHSHHRYMDLLSYLIFKTAKIPAVTTVHSLVSGKKLLSYRNRPIIAVSSAVKNHLVDNYSLPPDEIIHLTNPVNPNVYSVNKNIFGIRTNKIVAYIGRISELKGIDILLRAFEQVRNSFPDAELHIAGDGDKTEYLKKYIEQDHNYVIYHGTVSDPGEMYKSADVVVLPSLSDSFPYGMLESGIFGKPFIGSNINGIKEYITSGFNGVLFPAGNSEILGKEITALLRDADLRILLGSRLRKKVLEENTVEMHVEKLFGIYSNCLNS